MYLSTEKNGWKFGTYPRPYHEDTQSEKLQHYDRRFHDHAPFDRKQTNADNKLVDHNLQHGSLWKYD